MGTALVVERVVTVVLWLVRSVIWGSGWESCYEPHDAGTDNYGKYVLFKCHPMWESTLGDFIKMFNNWFSLGMTVVTGTLLQSKSRFLPRCLTDWRFDKNYSLGMTGGEMFRLIVITGMNQLPSSGSLKEKHSMKHCNQFTRALEGTRRQ